MVEGAVTGERHPHYAYIAALRGIAALAVLAMHVMVVVPARTGTVLDPFIEQGRMGVLLFFALSAYSLSLSHDRSRSTVAAFYVKRFFRIAPLFYLASALTLFWFASQDQLGVWLDLPSTIVRNALFVFNFDLSGSTARGIALGAWSIGVEMPFYLAFPLLVRYASSLQRTIVLFVGAAIVSIGFRWALSAAASADLFGKYGIRPPDSLSEFASQSIFTNLPYFALGFVAFRLIRSLDPASPNRRALGLLATVVGACGLIGTAGIVDTDAYLASPFPVLQLDGVFCAFVLIGLALAPVRVLVNRVTSFFGDVSYGVYLLHPLVIFIARPRLLALANAIGSPLLGYLACLIVIGALTAACAYVTYRFVELPGIDLGARIGRRLSSHGSRTSADLAAGSLTRL